MAITQSFSAGGTAVITIAFEDENGDPITPNSASWSLYRQGKIINSRQDVTISGYYDEDGATKADVVLQGDDLVGGQQTIVVKGEYDSSAGTGLPFRAWSEIQVERVPYLS